MAGYVQLIEDGDAQAFRWGGTGRPHSFRTDADGEIEKAFRGAVAEGLVRGEAHLLEGVEREVARKLSAGIGIRKDANDSIFVTWYLPDGLAQQVAALVPGGTAQDAHLTLLYLGDPDADGSGPWDLDHVAAVCKMFSMEYGPVDARISGLGRFVGDGSQDYVVALVDAPALGNLRACLKERLLCSGAIPGNSPLWSEAHGFVPHITIAQPQAGMSVDLKMQDGVEFDIDGISLSYGAQHADYKFPEYSTGAEDAVPYYRSRPTATVEEVERAVTESTSEGDMVYVVEKSDDEHRYTLGPLYAPEREDAHGEGVDAETLQKAVWDYVRESSENGRRLNLQHGVLGDLQVGEWVEVMAWPYEHEITLKDAEGGTRTVKMPAGTVYMGVQWDEPAWPLVKSGKLAGYSLGGTAVKVRSTADWEPMGGSDDTTKAGRVLSGANMKRIQAAVDALQEAISSAMKEEAGAAEKAAPSAGTSGEVLELLAGAAEQLRKREVELVQRESASSAEARAQARQDRETLMDERALLRETVEGLRDALAARSTERPPDLHVHVPEQNLTIHAGDDADVTET